MRFATMEKIERRQSWRRWFAWHPVLLWDTGETAWLETVWRRDEHVSGWGDGGSWHSMYASSPALSHPEPAPMRSERSERATSLLPAKEGE